MLVFNLTKKPLDYRGKTIPPNGGSVEFGDLKFVPDRDRELEKAKKIAFNKLPFWYVIEHRKE